VALWTNALLYPLKLMRLLMISQTNMSLLWLIYGALTINSVNKQNKYGCKEYMSVFQSLYATLALSLHTQTAFSFFLLFHLFWSSSAWQVCKYDSQNLFNASSFKKKCLDKYAYFWPLIFRGNGMEKMRFETDNGKYTLFHRSSQHPFTFPFKKTLDEGFIKTLNN